MRALKNVSNLNFQFQYEMPESPTTAMNSERPWGEMDDSRRSSLRSTSIYDMEGTGYAGNKHSSNPQFAEKIQKCAIYFKFFKFAEFSKYE